MSVSIKGDFLAVQDAELISLAEAGMDSFLIAKDLRDFQSRADWLERSQTSQWVKQGQTSQIEISSRPRLNGFLSP